MDIEDAPLTDDGWFGLVAVFFSEKHVIACSCFLWFRALSLMGKREL